MAETYQIRIGGAVQAGLFRSFDQLAGRLSGLNGLMAGFGKTLVGAFAGIKLTGLVGQSIQAADQLNDLSERLGISVQDLSRLEFAAQRSGTSLQALQTGVVKLSQWMQRNGQQSKGMMADLVGLAEEFQRTPEGPERLRLAVDRLGKSGVELIPILAQGPAAVEALAREADRLGTTTARQARVAGEWNDALDAMKRATGNLALELSTALLPGLTTVSTAITDALKWLRESPGVVTALKVALEGLAIALGLATVAFIAFKAAMVWGSLFGGIASLKDLVITLGYWKNAALAAKTAMAASTLLPIAAAITAITGALMIGAQAWKLWGDRKKEAETAKDLAWGNDRRAEAIDSELGRRVASGRLPDEERQRIMADVEESRLLSPNERGKFLNSLLDSLNQSNEAAQTQKQLTKDIFETKRKEIDFEIEKETLIRARAEFENRHADAQNSLAIERSRIEDKRLLVSDALERRVITESEAERFLFQDKKALFELEKSVAQMSDERLKRQLYLEEEINQRKLSSINLQRSVVQSDFRLTDNEKREREMEILKQETDLMDQQLAILRERRSMATGDAANATISGRIDKMQQQRDGVAARGAALGQGPAPNSVTDQLSNSFTRLREEAGTIAQQIGATFSNVIGGAINGISQGITGLIMGTQTWAQTLNNIATSVLSAVIDGIVKMFATWIIQRGMAAAKNMLFSTKEGAVDAAAKAPGAVMASISSFGIAAAVGLAAVVAALAAFGGFESGGYTGGGGRGEVAGVVHGQEFVIPANRVDQFGADFFEGIRTGSIVPEDMEGNGKGGANVNASFAMINTRQEMREFMAGEGIRMVYDYQSKRTRRV